MLHHISWTTYFFFVAIAAVFYYILLAAFHYRHRLLNKPVMQDRQNFPDILQQFSGDPLNNNSAKFQSLPADSHLIPVIAAFKDEVIAYLEQLASASIHQDALLEQLSLIAGKYAGLANLGDKQYLNRFISEGARSIAAMDIEASVIEGIWKPIA